MNHDLPRSLNRVQCSQLLSPVHSVNSLTLALLLDPLCLWPCLVLNCLSVQSGTVQWYIGTDVFKLNYNLASIK